MTEEELAKQVRKVAAEAKAEVPVVRLKEPPCKGPHVLYLQAKGKPAEMQFCPEVGDMPASIREFLIAQEFAGRQAGMVRRLGRVSSYSVALALVLGLGINLLIDRPLWFFIAIYLVLYAVLRLLGHAIVVRRLQRATDRQLVEWLSRDQVVETLNLFHQPDLKATAWQRVQWLLRGAPPSPQTRLRWLNTKGD
ncbi:hypothetical protein OG394_34755 [Kribbella sp. NBC_01245]|uniref:hypothetical protein n=1 Tax=Kribbella sp. NBC_01245 TaxID=2903578 RepID=UPI002E28B132|nr:hypothetical protein [Kribbella sp. NBC_01245]